MVAAALLGVGVSTAPKAKAANLYWDSDAGATNGITDGAGTWAGQGTATFFNPLSTAVDVVAAAADIGYFGVGGVGGTVNLGGAITIGGLVFGPTSTTGYSLSAASAQTLTIAGTGIAVSNAAQPVTVGSTNLTLTLSAAQSWINSSASSLTIGASGSSINNSTFLTTIQAQAAGNIVVAGNFAGSTSGGVTVNSSGVGAVILSGNNTYTGNTTLTAGILRATGNINALGTGASALTLTAGTLQLAGGLNFARNTTVGGPVTIVSDNNLTGAGTTDTLGTLSIGANTLTVNAGPLVNSGTAGITFGAATMTGAATFNTNNSFFNPSVGSTTTLASLTGTFAAVIGGTGNTTITGLGI
jgi:autotransporter-associated beta strand protein